MDAALAAEGMLTAKLGHYLPDSYLDDRVGTEVHPVDRREKSYDPACTDAGEMVWIVL
jgi:hypothetical protein